MIIIALTNCWKVLSYRFMQTVLSIDGPPIWHAKTESTMQRKIKEKAKPGALKQRQQKSYHHGTWFQWTDMREVGSGAGEPTKLKQKGCAWLECAPIIDHKMESSPCRAPSWWSGEVVRHAEQRAIQHGRPTHSPYFCRAAACSLKGAEEEWKTTWAGRCQISSLIFHPKENFHRDYRNQIWGSHRTGERIIMKYLFQTKAKQKLTWFQNSVDELLAGDFAIMVSICSSEEVHDARFVVVHPIGIAFSPLGEIEALHSLHLQRI